MSKADIIIEKWKKGEKQAKIASDLKVSTGYVSQVLAPLKIVEIPPVPKYIKNLFDRINKNLDKTWGYDNKMGKEKGRPKYRNLWEDWNFFKDWFESLS